MQKINVYGIKNCDTVKKSLRWFHEQGVEVNFIDFKKTPPSTAQVMAWAESLGWDKLINKRGTTWRKLDDQSKANSQPEFLAKLLVEQPSLIKRPLVETKVDCLVGFQPHEWQQFTG